MFGILLVVLLQLAPTGVWPWLMARLPFKPARKRPDTSLTLPARDRPAAAPGVLLQIDNARKQFGGVIAVNDVSFDVQAREIVALIGPNGAGKSTTFNLITGVLTSSGGTISVLGRNIDNAPPQEVAKLGIARTFQHVKLVPDMSVLENVAIGAHLRGHAGAISSMFRLDRADEARLLAEAARQIERVGLGDQIDQLAGSLSLGQQRIVEIARALCVDPMLLLLDEPAAGLRHMEKQRLAALLRQIARRRHVGAAGRARHGIRDGSRRPHRGARLRHQDRRGHARRDQDQSGRDQGLSRSGGMSALLKVADAHVAYGKVEAVRSVSLEVGDNEIVTIIGANGAGKTTLLNAIMGILPLTGGVAFAGEDIARLEIEDRVAAGLSLVPEHRELFGTMNVEDNLQLGAFRIAKAIAAQSFERVYTLFPRLKERRKQLAGTLSGGEQQMLAMGRALMGAPKLLMLDEPSLGLAPIIVADIFRTIGELRAAGVSVLLVEQNAQAALKIADRAYVMELGEFILNGPASDIATNAARGGELSRLSARGRERDLERRLHSIRACASLHPPLEGEGRSRMPSGGGVSSHKWSQRRSAEQPRRGFVLTRHRMSASLWRALKELPVDGTHFRRQAPIGPYVVDFFCPAKHLIIELDGGHHNEDETAKRDRREAALAGAGRISRHSLLEFRDHCAI